MSRRTWWSESWRPSLKRATNNRRTNGASQAVPRAAWVSRWASKVLPRRTRSKSKVKPTSAPRAVICAWPARTCSGDMPYLRLTASSDETVLEAGALGSSSKARWATVTASPCSKSRRATSRRAVPSAHQGQA